MQRGDEKNQDMQHTDLLDDDLWNSVFPVIHFYVKFIAPVFLLMFLYFFVIAYKSNLLLKNYDFGPLLFVFLYTIFHWCRYRDLKNKKSYDAGVAQAVRPGDTVGEAKVAIILAIYAHSVTVLGFTGFYAARVP